MYVVGNIYRQEIMTTHWKTKGGGGKKCIMGGGSNATYDPPKNSQKRSVKKFFLPLFGFSMRV